MEEFKRWPNSKEAAGKWKDKIGEEIRLIKLYWNIEAWNNGSKNERFIESLELQFRSHAVFYFCGDVDTYNEAEQRYNLLSGRSFGLMFYSTDSFRKHKLHKVENVEEVKAQ